MADPSVADQTARAVPESQAGGRFLSEASRLLADSLDYETTLATVAALSLPYLGAWCIVDLCTETELRRAAVIHTDPEKQALARRLEAGWPPERDDPFGVPRAVRTRETEVIADVPDEMLTSVSRSDENLQILRELGMGSLLVVPLLARGDVLGAITYVSPHGGRAHGADDVELAEDLASRCGIALDNARLHRAALEAQRVAEVESRAKSRFLAFMSHELRSPLFSIGLFAELIENEVAGPTTERQKKHAAMIKETVRHLDQMIDELLTHSRLEAGAELLGLDRVDVLNVVREATRLLEPQAETKGLAFRCDVPDHAIEMDTDAGKVRQILANLLGNAVKFTEQGEVALEVEEDATWVRFRVCDTGSGIAPEDRERIFEPFVQAAGAYARGHKGTGLGLVIGRRYARLLGGEIDVESTPGLGSTFTLRLPQRSDTEP